MSKLSAHLAYYGRAAFHTFWEAALGSLLVALGGSGLDFAHLPSLPVLEKIGGAAVVAGLAAIFTYVKQLAVLPPPGTTPAVETTEVTPAELAAASEVPPVIDPSPPPAG